MNSTNLNRPFGIPRRCVGFVNGRMRILSTSNVGMGNVLGTISNGSFAMNMRRGIGMRNGGHPMGRRISRICRVSGMGCAGCVVDFGWTVTGGRRRLATDVVSAFHRFGRAGGVSHAALMDMLRRDFHGMLTEVFKDSRGFSMVMGPSGNSFRVCHGHIIITSNRMRSRGGRVALARTHGVRPSCRMNRSIDRGMSFGGFNHHTVLALHRALTSGVLRLRRSSLCGGCGSHIKRMVSNRICRM